jgi:hypothetical protein
MFCIVKVSDPRARIMDAVETHEYRAADAEGRSCTGLCYTRRRSRGARKRRPVRPSVGM